MESIFPKLEEQQIEKWKAQKAFKKSIEKRKGGKRFVFYDGPPTANAAPGFHHLESRAFKDIILRYKTMRGFLVERRAGWDTHGLPVELQIEKKLGLTSKKEIEKYGIAKFNEECRQSVWEFIQEWRGLTERTGFWIDMDDPYITYTPSYMESLWFVMAQFWKKRLLYEGHKVVPYCSRCGTPLSSHELAQGYKTVSDRSVYAKFKVKGESSTYILAWTTTPWTLPGNVALAVGENIPYVKARKEGEIYILAKDLVGTVLEKDFEVIEEVTGKDLEGIEYEPLYDSLVKEPEKKHYVALADFVTTEDGTGVVHTAVMYGEDDYRLGQKLDLPKRHTVNEEGKFNELVPQWEGLFVKHAEPSIVEDLEMRNLLFKSTMYEHEYPHCWRCATPLLYYAKESWFIDMQKVKKDLIVNNKKVNWFPAHIKEGRMGEWLKEVKDWAFSRERYWGTPLPIWRCQECDHREAIDSVAELKEKNKTKNTYYILRHGHSDRQKTNAMSSLVTDKVALTPKGKKETEQLAKKLKTKNIDVLLSSDLLRTKQTAEIVSKELNVSVVYDKRLREVNVGVLNGRKVQDIQKVWGRKGESEKEHFLRRFTDPLPGGEHWVDIQKRILEFVKDTEEKYEGKNILVISHELPLSLMESLGEGFSREEVIRFRKNNSIKTGELRKLSVAILPYRNDTMELDLHRPYIDEMSWPCEKCGKGSMKRVKDVVDVWFDSGAMPYAQAHWPFDKNGNPSSRSNIKPPTQFPADYITEAIDQTRGWFYTLLATSTLLGFDPPYKNVISMGHILDAKGEKMSKSKGNVVNPWEMVEKYGADAVRWYMYTINQPGDPKLFAERDLQQSSRRFLSTLWNSYLFYETYAPGGFFRKEPKLSNPLDAWIMSRLNTTLGEVTMRLDAYDITGAARTLEALVVNDLSLWYIRRARGRFQNPTSKQDLAVASHVLGTVLMRVAAMTAPFTPFIADTIFSGIVEKSKKGKTKQESIHWQDWPVYKKSLAKQKTEAQMKEVRDIVATALAERAQAGIKIRQPLAALTIDSKSRGRIPRELLSLLEDELNVKEIRYGSVKGGKIMLDTEITPELKEEGTVRELLRSIQGMRKDAGYKPRHRVRMRYAGDEWLKHLIFHNQKLIKKSTGVAELMEGEREKRRFDIERELTIDGKSLWLGMRKL